LLADESDSEPVVFVFGVNTFELEKYPLLPALIAVYLCTKSLDR